MEVQQQLKDRTVEVYFPKMAIFYLSDLLLFIHSIAKQKHSMTLVVS